MSKLIAIDFDDTITTDAELWRDFVAFATKRGHRCYLVTCRRETVENQSTVEAWLAENQIPISPGQVIFTNLGSKLDYMQKHGIKVDIWIDDDPRCVIDGK